jgi:hypothetical protein
MGTDWQKVGWDTTPGVRQTSAILRHQLRDMEGIVIVPTTLALSSAALLKIFDHPWRAGGSGRRSWSR